MTETVKSSSGSGGGDETPQSQRKLYKGLGYKTPQAGDIWYPISVKWYKAWIEYTAYNKKDEDIDGGVENLHLRDVARPEAIDNSELADPEDVTQLKKDLEEHLTHEWLHSSQWKLLHSWYGGGPEFPRNVYERGTTYSREKYIDMYPKFLKFVEVNPDGTYDLSKVIAKSFPEQYTWQDVVSHFEGRNNQEENEEPLVHLWMPFGAIKKIYPIVTKRGVTVSEEDLKNEDPNRYVEVPDDHLKQNLGDITLPKDVIILVERKIISQNAKPKNDNSSSSSDKKSSDATANEQTFPWPLVKGPNKWKNLQAGDILDGKDDQGKWYEAYIRFVGENGNPPVKKVAVHFIGWPDRWDEMFAIGNYERLALRHSQTKGKPYRPQQKKSFGGSMGSSSWSGYSHEEGSPDQVGIVGLRNLGNTCFMNSTIQCLAQSPYLTDYFLQSDFMHHINYNNPLGWKGKVAQAWAQLLRDMFSNKYKVLAPKEFKNAIGEVAPRFMGYSQQDSQELLSFLLDGLHEDLNQIQQKPGTEAVESNGRPDEIVAAEAWRTYLKRNVSIVVDLLQGQYKSRVECPDCSRVSITFDPYMFLSVPLPTERYKTMEFTLVGIDPAALPVVYGIKVLKMADVSMLKNAIAKQFNVDKDFLFVCDVWKSKIHRELRARDMISDINPRNDDIVVFYAPKVGVSKESTPVGNKEKEKDDDKDKDKDNDKDKDKNKKAKDKEEEEEEENNTSQKQGGNREQQSALSEYKIIQVLCQTRVQVRTSSFYSRSQYREEDELIGMPLLLAFPINREVSQKEARQRITELIKPYLLNKEWIWSKDKGPAFQLKAVYGNNASSVIQVEDKPDPLPFKERLFKFVLHFPDRSKYNEEACLREKRARHTSAPSQGNRNNYSDDDRSNSKPVMLSACIDAFTEEEILDENDAWYCSKCSDFKCAKKKIDLWSSPDLLIIHLKRFSYTRQWRDRINTLVQFPLTGLDMSPWIVSQEHKRDAIYDLYGISNHMGGMGGGHYTAYARNLRNGKWYHLDDSRTSEVRNPETMVTSAAYVLYYQRRNPRKIKHRASRVVVPQMSPVKTENKDKSSSSTGKDEDLANQE